ncbi:hypothetical protein CspeluHIS016_0501330 [Cutaneotrichosporon spelunceum]|uniref:F-box domain-containing protein n=1 Tax=Cutaneotrichosporon spelunceum TaxID=1672016 RepID=A0AAD3YCI6_9TREE|nr:hypothetical protein CspeluHIS016_0501330 [Cutaneotrichosporon spelunceum]
MSPIALDELSFPGVVDQIFAYASRDALLVMRQVSHAWRDRADARFVSRVTVGQRSDRGKSVVEMRGPLGVIPRQDWYESNVGDATRVLDLGCGGSAAALAGLCRLRKLDLLRDHGYVMRNRAPLPRARAYLMNRVGVDTFASYWDHLIISLPYFQPTFVPLENVFGSHGSFPKSLAGAVQNMRGTIRRPSVLPSSVSFGDNGRASHLAAPHPRVSALGAGQYTGFVIPLSRPSRSFHVPGALTLILARPPTGFAPRPQGVPASRRAPRRADDYEGTFRNMSCRIAKILADGGQVPTTLVGFDAWFAFLPHNRVCSYDTLMDEIRRLLADYIKTEDGVEERMACIEYLSLDEYRDRVGSERFRLETEFADTMGPGLEDDPGRTVWTPPRV